MRKRRKIMVTVGVNPRILREKSVQLSGWAKASKWPENEGAAWKRPADLYDFLPQNPGIYSYSRVLNDMEKQIESVWRNMMSSKRFLITGATGTIGATGRKTVELLLERGHQVRAFVHKHDERSAQLEKLGVEIAVGDLLDFTTIRPALEGVWGAYFVYPIAPGLIESTAYFAQAAKEANVPAIVNMSQISARREAKSHAAFNHWMAERVFDWPGLAVTHLRPTFFAEGLGVLYRTQNIKDGLVQLPFGESKHAPIAAEDQARLIASILENPSAHTGKIYRLFGPKEYTYAEAFEKISQILGRKIKYERISLEAFREQWEQIGLPFLAQHLFEVAKDHAAGIFSGTDEVIEQITGQPPMDLEAYIRKHREAFE
jgi:NAD(P)H dehydrogenase (quinone)